MEVRSMAQLLCTGSIGENVIKLDKESLEMNTIFRKVPSSVLSCEANTFEPVPGYADISHVNVFDIYGA